MTVLDYVIIAGYAVATLVLGWYFGRRQSTAQEYFVGSGNMNPFLIGVSLFATLLSTISYLSMPGEAFGKGPANMMSMVSLPLCFVVVSFVLLPIYMKQRVTSAYELLEHRLGREFRIAGAVMFVALRLVWMSLLVNLAGKALTVTMGVSESWTPLFVCVVGVVAVVYTSVGGLRAVVVTDAIQTCLLMGGAVVTICIVTYSTGSLDWFPTKWQSNWDTQPWFSFDPYVRSTYLGAIFMAFVWNVCTAGGDQTSVQRFMATKDARAARRAYATQLTLACCLTLLLSTVGFALLGYYREFPELWGALDIKNDADKAFPHFIASQLPPGISGLVVSAMLAAAMSSIDSGVNSITAVVFTDFLSIKDHNKGDKRTIWLARSLAFGIGVIVVIGSSFVDRVPGNITGVTQRTTNLLVTPIFALFFFALFVPFAHRAGVALGAVCGIATAIGIAFSEQIAEKWDPSHDYDAISFQWIGPIALGVNLGVGTVVSLLLNRLAKPRSTDPDGA